MKKAVTTLSILTLLSFSVVGSTQTLNPCEKAAAEANLAVDQAIKTFQELLAQTDRSEPKAVEQFEFLVMGLSTAKNFIQTQGASATCQR